MLRHDLADGSSLRLLEEGDARELADLVDAERDHLAAWMPWVPDARDEPAALDFIRLARRRLAENGGMDLAVVRAGAIRGVVGTHGVDWTHRATSLGYWLAAPAQGRGTMTLAVAAVLDHAFGPWGLHRVEIRAAPGNVRSRAIPERLGFREEGIVREVERVRDGWRDHVVYGLLAPEWRAAKP